MLKTVTKILNNMDEWKILPYSFYLAHLSNNPPPFGLNLYIPISASKIVFI